MNEALQSSEHWGQVLFRVRALGSGLVPCIDPLTPAHAHIPVMARPLPIFRGRRR